MLKNERIDVIRIRFLISSNGIYRTFSYCAYRIRYQVFVIMSFCKEVNGTRKISAGAIELFKGNIQADQQTTETTDKRNVSFLMEQIKEKDNLIHQQRTEIEELTKQIKELQQHILTQAERTTAVLEKQSQLQENFQILLGQQQRQMIEQQSQSVVQPCQPVEQPVEQPTEKKRKTLFRRLFDTD